MIYYVVMYYGLRITAVRSSPRDYLCPYSGRWGPLMAPIINQLLVAASKGDVLALCKLLNGGADTNTADERGMTLYRVSDNGNADTVEILLKEGGGAASASGTRKGARLCTPPAPMTTMP